MKYASNDQYTIYNMSCLDLMDSLEENSVDAIVTDPPYEIGFMNKGWDNTGIAFSVDTWKKALRVLKPGGYLLAFNHSRTFHRMMVAIEDAGFELRDTIMWLYGSGFPKSHNISKAIDKMNGELGRKHKFTEYMRKTGLSATQLNNITNSFMGSHYLTDKEQAAIPTKEYWELIKKHIKIEIPNEIEYLVNRIEAEREVIGKKIINGEEGTVAGYSNGIARIDGKNITQKREVDITIASTPQAKQWDGYGTALKPAFEPIVMARKPFNTSVAENVLTYGTGGINIDECRIETDELKTQVSGKTTLMGGLRNDNSNGGYESTPNEQGRFPANVIHDGSKEATRDMWDWETDNDASRYFYCAKASVKDRDEGLSEFESGIITDGREKSIDNAYNRGESIRKNIHPTVKPTELMQYLVRLVTPKGGTILDIFMGSGSTGKATMIENVERNANYHFIGVDLEKEYCEIAQARIEYGINFKDIKRQESETIKTYDDDGKEIVVKQMGLDL